MKKHDLIFGALKIPGDFLIIFFSFLLARLIRINTDFPKFLNLPKHTIPLENIVEFALYWASLYVGLFFLHKLYALKSSSSKIKETLDILLYSFYWLLFYSVIVYFTNWIFYSFEIPRLIIIYTFILWTFLVILSRFLLNKIQNYLLNKSIIPKTNLLLINNKNYWEIKNIIENISQTNSYNIIWYINSRKHNSKIKYLWNDIKDALNKHKIDEILYIDSEYNNDELFNIWDLARIKWIRYKYITNSFDVTKLNTEIWLINKIPVVEIKNTSLEWFSRLAKRLFDLIISFFWIILFSPFLFLVWFLIKLENPKAPAIYKNLRVWQSESLFFLYKFRYMKWEYCVKDSYWIDKKNDEALKFEQELIKKQSSRHWALYKIKNDPRKTKIWAFIEKYSIDELPQLFNVIMWNMSLVWPRPHQPREVEKYETHQKRVLNIKPWITGLPQVNWRENNSFDQEVKLDIFYMENWSFLLDFKILFKTIWVVLKRK